MATENDVLWFKKWFGRYVQKTCIGDKQFYSAIQIKVRHSHKVAEVILDISESLGLNIQGRCLAEIIAILHDIGRFEQYTRYHTYSDIKSENHAVLGVGVIQKQDVLSWCK